MRLTARSVTYTYPGRPDPVLDGIDLAVEIGDTVAIMGPSGSGKTTALALLGGLLSPHDGTIGVIDQAGRVHASATYVAWILQTTNVLPDRSVRDNVALGAIASGWGWKAALVRAADVLSEVGLADRARSSVRVLSGGEVQRVVIARALASDRPFLLADEPTGQLDARTTESVLDVLVHPDLGKGLVVVTHDEDVARRCGRVFRLQNGRWQEPAERDRS